jgi:hypothetical protein
MNDDNKMCVLSTNLSIDDYNLFPRLNTLDIYPD